jgi:hypothetical protein
MSVEGRITVDALFHDKDGTNAVNVVSLAKTTEYATGKVLVVTGTAGTAQTTVLLDNVYRDATGQPVVIGEALRIAFSWDRDTARRLEVIDFDDGAFCTLASRSNDVAVSAGTQIQQARLTASSGNTGTYTIIVYGT